jgi:hypothetical protein
MVKKDEAEQAVRYFCTKWAEERGLPHQPDDPSFSDFYSWLQQKSPPSKVSNHNVGAR